VNISDGFELVVRAATEAMRPDPELHVDQWATEFQILPKSSPKPGPFKFDSSYPARRVHQVLSPGHPCKRVVARVASQMFKTQTALNWIASIIHRRPRNILALQPTETLVKRFSARVSTMMRSVPELGERVAAAKSRDSRNTVQAKDFLGDATLYMNTAGSAANLAEVSAPYIYFDEIDRAELSVDGEGDPVEIAEARATRFEDSAKFFYTSSPSIKGLSKIDELFEMGTREAYHVPCPHCDHLHELVLDNFKFQRDPDSGFMARAWFVCPDCGAEIDERHKTTMLPDEAAGGQARWVAMSEGDGETVSFQMSAFYMPVGGITWLSLARQYARAKDRLTRGDHEAMQVFYNTRLGLSYQNTENTSTARDLQARAEKYDARVLPDAALVVTLSVDTQPNRLEYQLEAWGPGLEHWLIDYGALIGSPSDPPEKEGSVWQRLDEIRRTPLAHASGCRPIMISAYGIDSGGANTQDVYNYGAPRRGMACVVLHGSSRRNRPIISAAPSKVDIEWGGTKLPQGAELWAVGTDVAKDYLFGRIQLHEGPGAMHLPDWLPGAWFEGFVVEQPRTRYVKGRAIREYVKPNGARNEPLDLSVYNLALAYQLGLHKWSALDWRRLRDKLVPKQLTQDMFATPAPAAPIVLPVRADLAPSAPVVGPPLPAASPGEPAAAAVAPAVVVIPAAAQLPVPDAVRAPGLPVVVIAAPQVIAPAPPRVPAPIVIPVPAAGRRVLSRGIA
jgi:phage terminase large subunit GpA-like protein